MKMIKCILLLILISVYSVTAQRIIKPTDSVTVSGKISKPVSFKLKDLNTFTQFSVPNQIIYNHKGEAKDTLIGIKGIRIKDLLLTIQIIHNKPKELNEIYLVFIGSDGYKVVFSWNEIWNTEAGNQFYIITELNGIRLENLNQRILFLSTADLKSGRRYIKGLEKIEVLHVQ